jgi:hypothetical protein
MNVEPQVICPNCKNNDPKLIEQTAVWPMKTATATKRLCHVCSKEWIEVVWR